MLSGTVAIMKHVFIQRQVLEAWPVVVTDASPISSDIAIRQHYDRLKRQGQNNAIIILGEHAGCDADAFGVDSMQCLSTVWI